MDLSNEKSLHSQNLTDYGRKRRSLVSGTVGAVLSNFAAPESAIAKPAALQQFLVASSKLTGIDDLDPSLGSAINEVFTLIAGENTVVALCKEITDAGMNPSSLTEKLAKHGLASSARALASFWYTGSIEVATSFSQHPTIQRHCQGGLQAVKNSETGAISHICLLTYDDALVWQSCNFTKPPASCGGAFGYWQEKPETKPK